MEEEDKRREGLSLEERMRREQESFNEAARQVMQEQLGRMQGYALPPGKPWFQGFPLGEGGGTPPVATKEKELFEKRMDAAAKKSELEAKNKSPTQFGEGKAREALARFLDDYAVRSNHYACREVISNPDNSELAVIVLCRSVADSCPWFCYAVLSMDALVAVEGTPFVTIDSWYLVNKQYLPEESEIPERK